MPRPSVKAERTEEILDAFERCIARFGVEGATLERIAEEAGLRRSLLRHYVGNKDDLLSALVDRFVARSKERNASFFNMLPNTQRAETMIEYLFDIEHMDSQIVLVSAALIAAAPEYPKLKPHLRHWVEDFVQNVHEELVQAFPKASKEACEDVAAGIVGIYFNVDSLTPLGRLTALHLSSKRAALRLLETLETQ